MYLLCGFFIVVCIVLYVRSRFWVRQPVRHWWSLPRPGMRLGAPPEKYVDHSHVRSFGGDDMPLDEVDALLRYVKTQTNDVFFPDADQVAVFLTGSFVSVYCAMSGAMSGAMLDGCIVGRPVDVRMGGQKYQGFFNEVMASDSEKVSRFLFCTHEMNKRKKYPDAVTIFRTSCPILFVVPTAVYDVRWVQTKLYTRYRHPGLTLVKATESNVHEIMKLWETKRSGFRVTPTVYQLVAWIKANLASVYYAVKTNAIVGMFFFRKSLMVDRNKCVIDCCSATVLDSDVGLAFSSLMHRYRRTFPIVRLHMQADVGQLPMRGWYKATKEYVFVYGVGSGSGAAEII